MDAKISSSLKDLQLNDAQGNQDGTGSPSSFMDLDPNAKSASLDATVEDLIKRGKTLYEEVETYCAAVEANQNLARLHNPVEYRGLRNDFKNELAFLNRLVGSEASEEKIRHYVVSSNLVYHEALWEAAKRSSALLGFRKYFFWNRLEQKRRPTGIGIAKLAQAKNKTAALVDIVASDGAEWVRVSTISKKRLFFDLAKLGWQNDSDDEDDDMMDTSAANWEDDDDDDDQVDVVKNARELARAARANPIRGRPPVVRFILTRIESGQTKEVDAIIQKIKATGAIVHCANELPPAPSLAEALPKLLINRSQSLSDTLNIDCTILLALISDISHKDCPILDWYPGEVRAQIKEEEKEKLLPNHLYPAISSHPMVCTVEAAEQMNLIVNTLATDDEKLRADLLLAQGTREGQSSEQLCQEWASLSDHANPEGFQLPIRVVPSSVETNIQRLPQVAKKIAKELSPLNTAIFCYGWAEGLTALSSNRARAKQIDHIINEFGLEDGQSGPHIWQCGESRSLIAKHGRRK